MIMLCYDGSEDARAAIEKAAELYPAQAVTVVTVWQPVMEVWARATPGFGMVPSIPNSVEIDEATNRAAKETAAEGVALADKLGLKAEPLVVTQQTTPGRDLLKAAEDLDASVIVMGTRGLGRVKSLLLGSVSHELIQRADRSVTVVPSSGLASSRAEDLAKDLD